MVRTVAGRLELRLPDPSCNVYAALAAMLAAGLDGLEGRHEIPDACHEDLYERFASGQVMPERLPSDLARAVEALEKDQALMTAVGSAFCRQFIDLKRLEWSGYAMAVSGWEMQHYAHAF
jgi:glutamine synthetase